MSTKAGEVQLGAAAGQGPREDRPDFQRLLAALPDIDVLVVWSMDRLTRDLLLFAKVAKALTAANVRIESLTAHVGLETPEGEAMAGMGAVFGQFERKRIAERVKSNVKARVRAGHHVGGPRPYGYVYEDDRRDDGQIRKRLVIHEPEAVIVCRLFSEFASGRSQQAICQDLNHEGVLSQRGKQWWQGTAATYLANPLYAGRVRINGETFDGLPEWIVSPELWDEVSQLRAALVKTKGGGRGRRPKGQQIYTRGLLRCGMCGSAMIAMSDPRTSGPPVDTYAGFGRRRFGVDHCPQKPIRRELIDGPTWAFFERLVLDLDATRQAITEAHGSKVDQLRALRSAAEREAQRAEARLDRVRRAFQDGKITPDDWSAFPGAASCGARARRKSRKHLAVLVPEQLARAVDRELADPELAHQRKDPRLRVADEGRAHVGHYHSRRARAAG